MLNWIFWSIGALLHFYLKADAAVALPNRVNPVTSRLDWFRKKNAVLIVRFFAGNMIFLIFIRGGAAVLGIHELPSIASVDAWVVGGVCGLMGLAIDGILDALSPRLPWLKDQIPPAPNGHDEEQSKAATA